MILYLLTASLVAAANDCGFSQINNWRITQGDNAARGAWPWIVSLDYPNGEHHCGGTIISPQWVLTAAHCVTRGLHDASEIHIRFGKHRLDEQEHGQIDLVAAKVVPHPDYRHGIATSPHDIALVKLPEPLTYTPSIRPICLPPHDGQVHDQASCVVAGWGVTQSSQDQNILQEAAGPLITHNEAKTVPEKRCGVFWQQYFTKNHFCFGGEGYLKGACNGDSGGPLFCLHDGRYVQYGVVTFGFARYCNAPGFESLYTKVPAYIKWLRESMAAN